MMKSTGSNILSEVRKTYSLREVIGQGSFGAVYKAVKRDTKETFAIKLIKFDSNNDYSFKMVLREVSILRQLTQMDGNVFTT
jgi:serine/threonine protein kinase